MNPITLLPPLFGLVVLLAVVVWAVTRKRELPEAIRSVMPGPPVEVGPEAVNSLIDEAKAKGRKDARSTVIEKVSAYYRDEELARLTGAFHALGTMATPPPPPLIDPKVAEAIAAFTKPKP